MWRIVYRSKGLMSICKHVAWTHNLKDAINKLTNSGDIKVVSVQEFKSDDDIGSKELSQLRDSIIKRAAELSELSLPELRKLVSKKQNTPASRPECIQSILYEEFEDGVASLESDSNSERGVSPLSAVETVKSLREVEAFANAVFQNLPKH